MPADLDATARAIAAEAGNQGPEGMAAVAHVINNRARLAGAPLSAVVNAPGQFEGVTNGVAKGIDPASPRYQQALKIAQGVLSGEIADPTNGGTHFLNPQLQSQMGRNQPAWAKGEGTRVGQHVFYSLPQDKAVFAAPGSRTAQADVPAADGMPTAPYKVAASGGKIPVPMQAPEIPQPPPHPNTAGEGTTTQRALAQSQAKYGLKLMIAGGATKNEGITAAGKAAFNLAQEYLKPTEIEKQLDAAGITGAQRAAFLAAAADKRPDAVRLAEAAYPGDPNRQRQSVQAGLPDHRPDVVKLGQAAQDTPGLVKSGTEAEAARKGADTTATTRATALTAESAAATGAGRAAKNVLAALDEAQGHYDKAVSAGGVGPMAANGVARAFDSITPDYLGLPGVKPRTAEVARQNFENAIATVSAAKTAAQLKGQGPVSNFERVMASADLPSLSAASPTVAANAFKRLRTQLNEAVALDDKLGLHAGESPATPRGGQEGGLTPGRYKWTPNGMVPQ